MATALGPTSTAGVAADEARSLVRRGERLVTLLIISPDYASHLLPLATLANRLARRGRAGGRRHRAGHRPTSSRSFGFERVGPASSAAAATPASSARTSSPTSEADALRGFFDATRRGHGADPAYQAGRAADDLMWNPVAMRPTRSADCRGGCAPTRSSSTTSRSARGSGCQTAGIRYADVVLGHPISPAGRPTRCTATRRWPPAFTPGTGRAGRPAAAVRRGAGTASPRNGTDALAPARPGGGSERGHVRASTGDALLLNYPADLHDAEPYATAPPARLPGFRRARGTSRRRGRDLARRGRRPVRLRQLRQLPLRTRRRAARGWPRPCAARGARGDRDRLDASTRTRRAAQLGWLVRDYLPQVSLLGHAALAVTHGGNNR